MADNLKFANAAFATHSMLPASDDEVNAIWGRKAASAAARAYGEWSTIVLSTTTEIQRGVATIVFDSLGFVEWPTVDIYSVRGGSQVVKVPWIGMNSYVPSAGLTVRGMLVEYRDRSVERFGEGMILINFWPDYIESTVKYAFTTGTGQQHWGTFLVRLRGN